MCMNAEKSRLHFESLKNSLLNEIMPHKYIFITELFCPPYGLEISLKIFFVMFNVLFYAALAFFMLHIKQNVRKDNIDIEIL